MSSDNVLGSQVGNTVKNFKVLVIDDDDSIRKSLVLNLKLEGFDVSEAVDGDEGVKKVKAENPDIILLDVMMPRKNGLEACKEIRGGGVSTPIILLTQRSEALDKVLGLDLGADDYVGKPFEMAELIARVKAQIRRSQHLFQVNRFKFANIVVDFKAFKAIKDDEQLELSAREFRLLQYLISHQGVVVSREKLLDEVWGYNSYPSTRTVDNHIARLRQKIEPEDEPKFILTVHGVGYKFVAN